MIIVKDNLSASTIYVPCNTPKRCEENQHTLVISSPKNVYSFDLEDEDLLSDFYVFTLDLSEIPSGEYTYEVGCDSSGIIRIGDYVDENKQYASNRKIIEYNAFQA